MRTFICFAELWWLWSYGSWIYNYLCIQCLSPLMLWVWTLIRRGVHDTTLYDKVYQWLVTYIYKIYCYKVLIFQPCNCQSGSSISQQCDLYTGRCKCLPDFNGDKCDSCLFGFYQYPNCLLCLCSADGTTKESCNDKGQCQCDEQTGQCQCKVSVVSVVLTILTVQF
jgi:hypothetical protein